MEINWRDGMSTRELTAIEHAQNYARHFQGAAIPGHTHVLLISKLAWVCDNLQSRIEHNGKELVIKKVSFDSSLNCWRDVETGVRVEIP